MPLHTLVLSKTTPAGGSQHSSGKLKPYNIRLVQPTAGTDTLNAALRTHPITRKYLRFLPETLTLDEQRQLREQRTADEGAYIFDIFVMEGNDETFAGSAGIFHVDTTNYSCDLGILLSSEFQQRGLATAALYLLMEFIFEGTEGSEDGKVRKPPLHRITFQTGEDNVGMRGWLENTAGIKLDGVMREAWKDGDGWSNMYSYGVLDHEWKGGIKARLEWKMGLSK